jgi:hypothetical protein
MLMPSADEEMWATRLLAPALAKACGMELRQQEHQQSVATLRAQQPSLAQALLREAQRPAAAISTFSAMLLPRQEEGDPDRVSQ